MKAHYYAFSFVLVYSVVVYNEVLGYPSKNSQYKPEGIYLHNSLCCELRNY